MEIETRDQARELISATGITCKNITAEQLLFLRNCINARMIESGNYRMATTTGAVIMTKKKWIDEFVKRFVKLSGADLKWWAKEAAQVSYLEYGSPSSSNYDKDYSPDDAACDEYYALCSDA